jgi:hypothetical protein
MPPCPKTADADRGYLCRRKGGRRRVQVTRALPELLPARCRGRAGRGGREIELRRAFPVDLNLAASRFPFLAASRFPFPSCVPVSVSRAVNATYRALNAAYRALNAAYRALNAACRGVNTACRALNAAHRGVNGAYRGVNAAARAVNAAPAGSAGVAREKRRVYPLFRPPLFRLCRCSSRHSSSTCRAKSV